VTQVTRYVKALLSQDDTLQDVRVRGEISDLVAHASGHVYFTLKDEATRLRCVMFRQEAETLTFTPEHGLAVVARGTVTVYEPRGQYQLIVRELERSGVGDLYLAFERLRRKLAAEGLFDEARKRPLPAFPRRIAVITSADGAAIHDVLTTLRARWPAAGVILIPTAVSGAGAEPEIVRALERLHAAGDVEVALLVRGGGSLEEMAGFNAESVARAIAAAPVPIVTGVGHETDFTIADLVADRRAPTPTGAAVAAAPDRRELVLHIRRLRGRIGESLSRRTRRCRRELELLRARPVLRQPGLLLAEGRQRLDETTLLLRHRLSLVLRDARERARHGRDKLLALSPRGVLERGYSITRLPDGTIVRSADQVSPGAAAEVIFARGSAEVDVRRTMLPEEERDCA
jgi:exodeoxyribonuclease VII large subunit